MGRIGWAVTAAVLLVGADRPASDIDTKETLVAEDLARLQGTWQLVSVTTDGEAAPGERVRQIRVTITGNAHEVRFGDQVVVHGVTFEIDPTAEPKEVTDTIHEGPQAGQVIRGIYRLEGDTLTSCVAGVGAERPTRFASEPGSGHTLRVFERVEATDHAKEAMREELERFRGTWRYESTVVEGGEVPAEALGDARLIIEGDRFEMTDPTTTYRGTFWVDPTAMPKAIDLTFTEGPEAGKTSKGIYELEGDTYKVCIGLAGKPRPGAFASEPGSGHALQVLRRVEP